MSSITHRRETGLSRQAVRTVLIASLGGMLEFYDFIIFVFFTQAIAANFFPPEMPAWLQQIQVFGLFAAGYLARPLGGVVMAHFGDLTGRKRMFMFAVMLMAVPTFLIGVMPGYARLGYAAPCLLLVCRILQGAAVGGEAPGAWVFVSEHVPARHVGLACGLLTGGLTGGILLGSLVNTAINLSFSPADAIGYAWRLPFLLGGLLGVAGLLLRRSLAETPVYEAMRREARLSGDLPIKGVVRDHGRAVLVSMMATWQLTAVIVVLILMAPTLLRTGGGLPASSVAVAGLAATAALTVSCVLAGRAIDRYGLTRLVWIAGPATAAAGYLLFAVAPRPGLLVPVFALVGALSGLITIVPVVLVRAFPAAVRFSGVSFSYNTAYAIAGGLTPPTVVYLFQQSPLAPAHYVAAVSLLCSAASLLWLRAGRDEPAAADADAAAGQGVG